MRLEDATMSGADFAKRHGNGAAGDRDALCLTPAQWAAREIPPQDLLLGHVFSTTTRTQLSADTGLGKTMFGLATALAKRLGTNFLHWQGHRQASVLYLDGEMPGELIKDRLAMAASWFGLEMPLADGFHLLSREDVEDMPPLDTPDAKRWLFDFMAKLGRIDDATFDNIASLTTGCLKEEDGARALNDLQRGLTKQRIGQFWLHHTGLDASRGYGPKLREWHLDTTMVAERLDRQGADVAFTLKFPKSRRRTPDNRTDFAEVEIELRDGQWFSSAPTARRTRKSLKPRAQNCLKALEIAITASGQRPPPCDQTNGVHAAVKVALWRDYFDRASTDDKPNTRREAFRIGTEQLTAQGIVGIWADWAWLT